MRISAIFCLASSDEKETHAFHSVYSYSDQIHIKFCLTMSSDKNSLEYACIVTAALWCKIYKHMWGISSYPFIEMLLRLLWFQEHIPLYLKYLACQWVYVTLSILHIHALTVILKEHKKIKKRICGLKRDHIFGYRFYYAPLAYISWT